MRDTEWKRSEYRLSSSNGYEIEGEKGTGEGTKKGKKSEGLWSRTVVRSRVGFGHLESPVLGGGTSDLGGLKFEGGLGFWAGRRTMEAWRRCPFRGAGMLHL